MKKITCFMFFLLFLGLSSCGEDNTSSEKIFSEKDEIPLYFNIANEYISLGLLDKAREEIDRVIKIDAKNPESYQLLGFIDTLENKSDEAIKNFEKAISLDDKYAQAYHLISLEYIKQGNLEKAKEYLLKLETFNPDIFTLSNLGNVYFADKNYDEAEKYLNKAIQLNENYHTPYATLAKIAIKDGKNEKAIEYLKKASKIKPDSIDSHVTLGNLYLGQFKLDEAQKEFEAVLSIDPDFVDVYSRIAFIYIEKNINLDKAAAFIQKGMKIEKGNELKYLDTLAWLEYRKGNFNKAKEHIDKLLEVVKVRTEFPPTYKALVFFHKGNIEYKLKNKNSAKEYLQKADENGLLDKYSKQSKEILSTL
ncbi:MAG: tetratricopeptide repeat protein [Nitrospinae bacterium]|nr:tetratricopeptide repeat protein [Nitrospinota bacterium]